METKELLQQIQQTTTDFAKALKDQEQQIKNFGTTSDKTVNQISELEKNYETLHTELDKLVKQSNRPGYRGPEGMEKKDHGQVFVDELGEELKKMAQTGQRNSKSIEFKSFYTPYEEKSLTSGPASAGVLIEPYRAPNIVGPNDRQLRIRDLLNVQRTNSNAIEYVVETGFTNGAAPQVNEGDLKAQSSITFDLETTSVKTIAHWIPASRQILDDASQLRAYVNGRLMYGLKLEEEEEILYGDGLSGRLAGIMTNANIQDHGQRAAADNYLDHIRKAMTKVRLAEYASTGLVLNPVDWETIELMKGNDGHYIWLNIGDSNVPRLFKMPVVDTTAIQQGEFLTGAFGLGAQLWDREQANVRFSEHHADYFARNMVAILAEERLALTIQRPEAFVKGDFTAAP
jgi:HK97 family phage major capsid protein